MPTARTMMGSGVIDGLLYVVGGEGNFTELTVNEAYDPVTNSWSTKAPALQGIDESASAALNGVLYAIGGSTGYACQGAAIATNQAYDPVVDQWVMRAPMPTPRCSATAAAANGLVYVIGGSDNCCVGYVHTVEAYNPLTDSWTTKAPMPTARGIAQAAVVNGIVYVVGGQGNGPGRLSTVEAYDPVTDSWTTKASMPTPRAAFGLSVLNGLLYALDGATDVDINTVEAYDHIADAWIPVAPTPTARDGVRGATVNGVLFAVGGRHGGGASGLLTTNEAFAPPYAFSGFFQPVDNPPIVNTLKAGSAVPVKFSLHGNQGLDIFATGFPSSQGYACDGSSEDAIEQTVTAGSSSLSYDATADQYTYVWKTDRAWAGTCRQFQLELKDGGIQVALFHFSK